MFKVSLSLIGISFLIVLGWTLLKTDKNSIEELTVAEASQSVFALLYIAQKKGYFADQGLSIKYQSFSSGRDALNSVLSGKTDIATTYETPVVLQAIMGKQISIITELHNSNKNTALIARKKNGINSVEDLAGKRIGVTKRTNAEFFLNLFLVSNGLSIKDVTLVNITPNQMQEHFVDGSVDAVATWNPHLLNIYNALPEQDVIRFSSDVYTEVSVLAGMQDVIERKASAFKKMLAALSKASDFLLNHPQESLDIVVARLKPQSEITIRATWNSAQKRIGLSNGLLTVLEDQATWLKEQGHFDSSLPNFRNMIALEYLSSVNPETVTILK